MKNKNRILFTSLITVAFASLASNASADVTKADNGTALNLTGSYVGGALPTSSDLLIVDGTLLAPRSSALGDNVSVLGITDTSAQAFSITNTNTKTLTIGASGINHTGAGTLTLASSVTLGAAQTWALNNRRLDLTNTLTTGGYALSITGATGNLYLKNTTVGTDVTIATGAVIVDGGNAVINGVSNTNGAFYVYQGFTADIKSMGNLGGASSIGTARADVRGTLNYTGSTATSDKGLRKQNTADADLNVTTAGETLSMSGNFTHRVGGAANSGFKFGGAGNLTLSGNIENSNNTVVTKNGTGTLTLSGTGNAYSGATIVKEGKLTVSGAGSINSTSGVTIGTLATAATSEFNYNSSVALTKAVTFAGTGGTLSGNATVNPAVNITTGNTLAIGASANTVGQMNFGDTLTLGGSTLMDIDSAASKDFANVTGALTYGGTMTLDMAVIFGTGSYTWNLFDFAGADLGTFTSINLTGAYTDSLAHSGGGVWDLVDGDNTWQFTESTGVLGLTVVPEPNVAALVGGLGMLCLLRRRRTA